MNIRAVAIAAISLAALSAVPASATQSGTWRDAYQSSPAAYDPLDPAVEKTLIEKFKIPPSALEMLRPKPPVSGTLRTRFAVSAAGSQLRIRISNEAGTKPLMLAGASVGLAGEGLNALPSSLRPLTFGGRRSIVIPAGAPVLSDPVDIAVSAQSELVVSTSLPEGIQLDPRGGGLLAIADGDQTMREALDGAKSIPGRPIVSGAEVLTRNAPRVIARAHARRVKLMMATILPMGGSMSHFNPEKEAIRQAVNTWIRTSQEPDAVIDFDLAARDPDDPAKMAKSYASTDNLHPGDAGYKAMGDAIDLSVFK